VSSTKKGTDWFGREKEEHFDDDGNKTGETRYTTDWLGNRVQEHTDTDGNKTGETRAGTDWLGNSRAEHYNADGERVGTSRNESNFFGQPVQRHYDSSGEKVGESRASSDWIGRPTKDHEGEYFKSRASAPSHGSSSGYSDSGYSAGTSGSASSMSGCAVVFVVLLVVIGFFAAVGLLVSRQNFTTRIAAPSMSLQKAKEAIPPLLRQIYKSLDSGDPHQLAGMVAPGLLQSNNQLDRICRPYSYRAHYIRSIIQRPDGAFEATVHVLFRPMEEHIVVFTFVPSTTGLFLQAADEVAPQSLESERQEAIAAARRFIFAASAGKQDVVRHLISPHLDVSPLFSDGDYSSRAQDVGSISELGAAFQQDDGLKVGLNVTTGRHKFCGDLWHLMVETNGNSPKIVEWEFVPIFGCYNHFGFPNQEKHIDPDLESYTLRRFGLKVRDDDDSAQNPTPDVSPQPADTNASPAPANP
jgi:Na+-transporting methylmalonyl-CoA/oxaloacetate decarboxylase gamma subunit